MTVLLWILQIALALLYLTGGAYKTFNSEELLKHPIGFTSPLWIALGVFEMAGAILLVVPAAMKWMPALTPIAAAALAVETLTLAWLYSRHSTAFNVENPMAWAIVMGLLAVVVTYGTYVRYAQAA